MNLPQALHQQDEPLADLVVDVGAWSRFVRDHPEVCDAYRKLNKGEKLSYEESYLVDTRFYYASGIALAILHLLHPELISFELDMLEGPTIAGIRNKAFDPIASVGIHVFMFSLERRELEKVDDSDDFLVAAQHVAFGISAGQTHCSKATECAAAIITIHKCKAVVSMAKYWRSFLDKLAGTSMLDLRSLIDRPDSEYWESSNI